MSSDPHSDETRSRIMSGVGSEDTAPELKLRKALWHSGLRYLVHEDVAGTTPDILFPGPSVAVFVDGCFWHGCPEHYTRPESNSEFWRKKLKNNRTRDRRDERKLLEAGWTVMRYWECEVNDDLDRIIREVKQMVTG